MDSCSDGWSKKTEFSDINNCTVYLPADYGLKIATAILAALVLLWKISILIVRRATIKIKDALNIILIVWTMIQNILMILQNVIGAAFNIRSKDTLWMALITHITAASAAGIVILFVYIEIKIRSQLLTKTSNKIFLRHKPLILIIIGISQALLFVIGPIISHFTNVQLHIMFWAPVVIIDFSLIPYFCFLTFLLYREISRMIHDDFKSLSRQLLLTGILCGSIGAFTAVVGLVSLFNNYYEWILIRAAWSSDIIVNFIFFIVLERQPVKIQNINITTRIISKIPLTIHTKSSLNSNVTL